MQANKYKKQYEKSKKIFELQFPVIT